MLSAKCNSNILITIMRKSGELTLNIQQVASCFIFLIHKTEVFFISYAFTAAPVSNSEQSCDCTQILDLTKT